MRKPLIAALCVAAIAIPAPARERKSEDAPSPAAFQDLVACRKIEDPGERLACYDSKVAAVEQAKDSGDLVVTDKQQIREARRGLFGFKLPTLGLFGHHGDANAAEEEISEIEGVIASAGRNGLKKWRFTLEDGAVWEQTDEEDLVFDPHKGSKVRIKNAALGTFKANIDGQRAIRVRRVE